MISRLRLGCGGCKPEKAEPKMMKPEAGRLSTTDVAKVTKVAKGQNG